MEKLSDKSKAGPKNLLVIGTQTGNCPICKETKELLILQFGLTLCNECLLVCINIMENLRYGVTKNDPKKNSKNMDQCKETFKETPNEKTKPTTQHRTPKTNKNGMPN